MQKEFQPRVPFELDASLECAGLAALCSRAERGTGNSALRAR